jgi:hypothetical protein
MQVYPMCAQIEQHILDVGLDKGVEDAVAKIFRERWDKMHSPLHSAAYMLEPQFRGAAFGREVMHSSPGNLLCFLCCASYTSSREHSEHYTNCCRSRMTSGRF